MPSPSSSSASGYYETIRGRSGGLRVPVRKVKILKYPEGKILDLSKWMGKTRNRIARVGLELEGGWYTQPAGLKVKGDGSVTVPSTDPGGREIAHSGEISSVPIEPVRIGQWMRHAYPQIVNKTCGLHIHLSMKRSAHYSRLMSSDFLETLVEELRKFGVEEGLPADHLLFDRLNGNNQYCVKKFWPDAQAIQKKKVYGAGSDGGRYTILNYCWGLNSEDGSPGTVEVRVLPMFQDSNQAVRAVHRIVDTTNAFLSATAARERSYTVTIEEPVSEVQDSQEIVLRGRRSRN